MPREPRPAQLPLRARQFEHPGEMLPDAQEEFDLAREELARERKRASQKIEPPPEASLPLSGPDPMVEWMQSMGIPITRSRYLSLSYPDGVPDPMPAELEAELPDEIRLP